VGILLLSSLVRLWMAGSGQLDLAQDEAQYWDWSRRLQPGYYSKGPLIAWIIAFWTGIFGNTELGVRFGAVAQNAAVQGLIYVWLAVLLRRPGLALATLLIVNTSPLFIAGGVLMTTDNPLLLCWLGGLVCLTGLTERPGASWPLWGLACCTCFGILAKYTMLAFIPLALIYAWLLSRHGLLPAGKGRGLVLVLAGGTLLGLTPGLIWNAGNHFVTFRHLEALAGLASAAGETRPLLRLDRFPEYLGSQALLILPWWLLLMLWQGFRLGRSCLARLRGKQADGDDRTFCLHLLLCLGFWPLWLFFLLWSFHARIYPNWSAMSYAAGFVLAAQGAAVIRTSVRGRRVVTVCAALSLAVSLAIHGQEGIGRFLPLPDARNPVMRLKGWSDLGQKLESVRLSMPRPEKVFFFSDAYDVTAAMAFYIPGHPVVYCADFGRRRNQYDLWPDPNGGTLLEPGGAGSAERPAPRAGWDAVYVTRAPMRDLPGKLRDMFVETGDAPTAYPSLHKGRPGRIFGFVAVYGFTGRWPRSGQERY
jgi:hypothetical protein